MAMPWARPRPWRDHARMTTTKPKRIATPDGEVVARRVRGRRSAALPAHAAPGPALPAPPFRSRPCGRTGRGRLFAFADRGGFLESIDEIPEPHAFTADVTIDGETHAVAFEEHEHAHGAARARQQHARRDRPCHGRRRGVGAGHRRADCSRALFGWLWMDPLAGIVGALVIASWSCGADPRHRRDPARHEPRPPHGRQSAPGDRERRRPDRRSASVAARPGPSRRDRLGGHADRRDRKPTTARRLARFPSLSHLTIEVRRAA